MWLHLYKSILDHKVLLVPIILLKSNIYLKGIIDNQSTKQDLYSHRMFL